MPSQADGLLPFQELQYRFTRHVRDPANAPAPEGIDDRRMGIYRDLLFKNVSTFLGNSFPVLRRISGDESWQKLMRDYFSTHRAQTPLFPKMPREFLQYLEEDRGERPEDPPFMRELAHYEWVEMALDLDAREIDMSGIDAGGDLLAGRPVLSPLACPLAYRFPVHRIAPEFQPREAPPEPTYLVVFRDRSDAVGFLELNPVAARLVDMLQRDTARSGREILVAVASELNHPDPEVVISGGLDILKRLHARDVVLGTL